MIVAESKSAVNDQASANKWRHDVQVRPRECRAYVFLRALSKCSTAIERAVDVVTFGGQVSLSIDTTGVARIVPDLNGLEQLQLKRSDNHIRRRRRITNNPGIAGRVFGHPIQSVMISSASSVKATLGLMGDAMEALIA